MDMRKVARIISIVGHPFLVVPLAIVLATQNDGASRRAILLAVGGTMLALTIYVVRKWRKGDFKDIDVSTREQRPRVFFIGIAASGLACLAMRLSRQNEAAIRGTAIACGTLVVLFLVNRFLLKASLHGAFSAMAAGIVWRANMPLAIGFAVLALIIGWSRVAYGRHTTPEVVVGLGIGAASAAAFVLG